MNKKIIKSIIAFSLVAVFLFAAVACSKGGESQQINLMTWADFIPREVIEKFEAETGIKVNYKDVNSNEDMQSLLEANPDQYDLAVVTDYMVDILRQNGNIAVLDKEKLPNFSNINPGYQGKYYDPTDEYSVPYAVSTSFLLVNEEAVADLGAAPIRGYKDLWQEELAGGVVTVDWSIEVIGFVLKSLGYEYNETDPDKVAEAREKLFELKKNIVRFETNTPEDSLINKEAVVGFMYSNQAIKGQKADSKLVPVFPEEGMPVFIDSFVMSKAAPNQENALKFLNYIMDAEVSAEISVITSFSSANKAAEEYLPAEFKDNPMFNYPDEVVENMSFYINVAEVTDEYDHIYAEFKLK
jgi:spermidine/putrescine-binding protein